MTKWARVMITYKIYDSDGIKHYLGNYNQEKMIIIRILHQKYIHGIIDISITQMRKEYLKLLTKLKLTNTLDHSIDNTLKKLEKMGIIEIYRLTFIKEIRIPLKRMIKIRHGLEKQKALINLVYDRTSEVMRRRGSIVDDIVEENIKKLEEEQTNDSIEEYFNMQEGEAWEKKK